MARRIEIELTSARPDGTWSWRAAGALNPRGSLDGTLLYSGAKQGDVVRAEADFSIDGISIISVEPPRVPQSGDPNRIELLDRPVTAGVTTQLAASRGGAGDRERGSRGPRGDRDERGGDRRHAGQGARSFERPGERSGSRGLNGASSRPGRPGPPDGGGPGSRDRNGRPARGDRPDRSQRATSPDGEGRPTEDGAPSERAPRTDRAARPARPNAGPGRGGPSRGPRPGTADAEGGTEAHRGSPRGTGAASRQRRVVPGSAHRTAMLESLPAEQQPIAQQLLRGGIPAVRTALHFEREKAREEGRPEPSTDGVLALAETLVSKVKAAEWRDRADAAVKAGDDLSMRDLRALVSAADAARDEASRELVVSLRELFDRRVEANRTSWSEEIGRDLDEGHVVRALRLSSRPPDAVARLSAELATRLRAAANSALSPSASPDQWLALLQAAAESPVRRAIKPEGLPASPTTELLEAARQQAGRLPGLAPLLGLTLPPPPPPPRSAPSGRPAARRLDHSGRPLRPRPPRPPRAPAQAPTASSAGSESFVRAASDQPAEPLAGADSHELPTPAQALAPGAETNEPQGDEPKAEFDEQAIDEQAIDEQAIEELVNKELAEATDEAPAAPEPMMDVAPEQLPDDVAIGAELTEAELAEG